jgi:hypothetical protein
MHRCSTWHGQAVCRTAEAAKDAPSRKAADRTLELRKHAHSWQPPEQMWSQAEGGDVVSTLNLWRTCSSWLEACMPSSEQTLTTRCTAIYHAKLDTCSEQGKNDSDEAAEVFVMGWLLQVLQGESASRGCPSKCETTS